MVFSLLQRFIIKQLVETLMRKFSLGFFTVISAFVLIPAVHAQVLQDSIVFSPDAENRFNSAMKLFRAGRYDTAAALFTLTVREFPRSHRTTAAFIMGGKAYYEINNFRESVRLLRDLIDLYPQSTYIGDAYYTLGLDYYSLQRYEDASQAFMAAVQTSTEQPLIERSKKLLETLTSSYLTLSELVLLQTDAKTDEMKALMYVRLAKKYMHNGNLVTANELLHKAAEMPADIKYVGEALSLLGDFEKRGGVKIGVLLPLMVKTENPAVRAFGMEFLQGIKLAVEDYNRMMPVKIILEIRDTERDPSIAARQVSDLCNDENISVIIGPILSSEVFASAGIANERGVPLITPTATASGIAAIGRFIFQANPDYNIRGRDVAAYAYDKLGARKFAVLAPADVVGKQITESFLDEVRELGGETIDVQWYGSGSSDMRTELSAMRRKALERLEVPTIDFNAKMKQAELNKMIHWGVNQHILDSLIERGLTAPVTLLFGERGAIIADSLKLATKFERIKYDSLGMPVNNIDAIFIPISSSDEIPIVSSQLQFFNIQSQVLGTGDWNDINVLDQNRQYTDGVIFTLDSYPSSEKEEYKTFVSKYRLANENASPGTNALFGYDVAKMVVQIISQGNVRRTEIADALAKVEGFEGLHSRISLSMDRVNSYLMIVQYKNRKIFHIGDIDLIQMRK
jgi:ABC-type branched-subunit amino acid transport system substrate-binding protein